GPNRNCPHRPRGSRRHQQGCLCLQRLQLCHGRLRAALHRVQHRAERGARGARHQLHLQRRQRPGLRPAGLLGLGTGPAVHRPLQPPPRRHHGRLQLVHPRHQQHQANRRLIRSSTCRSKGIPARQPGRPQKCQALLLRGLGVMVAVRYESGFQVLA
ncbi:hypothetical protein B0T22DRAFT_522394, partial [Podospora appendiculata]